MFVCARRLYPANPGWGSWFVCLGSDFGFQPAISGCDAGLCVFVCALHLYPASSGLGVRGACVLRFGSDWAPPFLAGVLGRVCSCARSACTRTILAPVYCVGLCAQVPVGVAPGHPWLGCLVSVSVCALRPYSAKPGWLVNSGCVGSGFGLSPQQSWLGCWGVCVCVLAPPVPPQSWLGFPVWVCVLGFGIRLRPAIPGRGCWGVCAYVPSPPVPRQP